MSFKPVRALASIAVLSALALLGVVAPSEAAGRDGKCDGSEFCYYYNSNNVGSVSDFTGSIANYGASQPSCYDFRGTGAGKNTCVKNHAASVWNRTSKIVRVYFNSNYGGFYQEFAPGAKGNLNASLKNQNASHRFFSVATPPPPITYAKPDFYTTESAGGFRHHAFASFRASDVHPDNGRHVKRVYVRLRLVCPVFPDDTGRVYSKAASSPSDTSRIEVSATMEDTILPNCDVVANWGAEYF